MLNRPKFQVAVKALILISLSVFFYTRIANGSLYFYINERFMWLVYFAVIGLLAVAISYQYGRAFDENEQGAHGHSTHDHGTHDHGTHDHHAHVHSHSHKLSWGGLLLVVSPILLGVLIPPQPLGASALENREVNVGTTNSSMPAAVRDAAQKSNADKNILDWLYEFQATDDQERFVGEDADLVGFIFFDERLNEDEFTIARFTVSCCVADASYVGLVVQWPDVEALEEDSWVRVQGQFAMGEFDGTVMPVLVAEDVELTNMPSQPYLYP